MKKIHKFLGIILACLMLFSLCACGDNGGTNTTEPQTFTIQYTDSTGVHSIEVQSGNLYSISSIPEKNGYEFMGLYDAEVGGTQYISAGGSSVSVFTDNKNIVLYPRFKAKEYTLVLDYQGAAVTGCRSMKVAYGSEINELPLNLTLENKNFQGWYTSPNCEGKQITDQYGVIPANRRVNETTFDLSDPNGDIFLYAGYEYKEFTVTFYIKENSIPEEVRVEYGTHIVDILPKTRVDGKAVLSWSKKRNDTNQEEIFNGIVTNDIILYAAEFAPIIEFDSNGGNRVNSLIAREGDTISLPTPIRENYKFVCWQTTGGSSFNATTMPTDSVKLTAKWQAMIIFDTNGGTEVANISEPQGTNITLPETAKEGYIFAGWYEGNSKVDITVMPEISMQLCAKYYARKTDKIIIISDSNTYSVSYSVKSPSISYSHKVDLSYLYNAGIKDIEITAHYSSRTSMTSDSLTSLTSMVWYSTNTASEAYKIWGYDDVHQHVDSNSMYLRPDSFYEDYVRSKTLSLTSVCLYICYYGNDSFRYGNRFWKNFWLEITYLDTSTLY